MKNDKKTNKKYLEVYSDLSRPLLTEYNFFRGLSVENYYILQLSMIFLQIQN